MGRIFDDDDEHSIVQAGKVNISNTSAFMMIII